MWTFSDDDKVSAVLSAQRLAKSAGRQELVVDNEPMIIDEQNVDAGFDITMLEGIVEQDNLHIFGGLVMGKPVNTLTAVSVDGDIDVGKLLLYLVRFIAYLLRCGSVVSQDISLRLPFIAT